ncbi:MAG: NADH-ubiquinone oxidoreductase chain N [uncultured Acidimicrobiales bacterium]|uniref:NADH-quinone oxidoreductase subunit N n=1 Tax=uncultured Acidimicrobiales bacterium TaxID=310071 RepID=A0A6J4HV53_9ACTN|nr:MAG: NADH-ubiquinone oxidoreductase chain N [uncultured Acidimicrobiales bacterium]
MLHLLAQAEPFRSPTVDFHAFAPEIVLSVSIVVVLLVDLVFDERGKWATSSIAGIGLLAALVPVLTLAVDGADRSLFDGAYVVDNFALVMKALFLLSGYVTILISARYIAEGDYYEGEYYFMLLCSLLGMLVMGSARDLISIFVALELLSIPAYLLAGWRKRDLRGNEASLKYYLLGVFAAAVMLYGMSLIFGVTGSTILTEIGAALDGGEAPAPIVVVGILFIVIGFAFKVSAVPFHTWAPDTYEGAPTPITAYLSVASKAAGFVALLQLVFIGFLGRSDVWGPLFWVLAAITMTVGNLIALRQTNIVRMLAYSSVAQAGFMLAPFAVAGDIDVDRGGPLAAIPPVVTYLLIYAAMNLGAFAVVMVVARKTRSGELSSYGGLFEYAPGLAVLMTVFIFALAGIPPLGGWLAKFVVFRALLDAGTPAAIVLAVIAAVNSVISLFYYASVAREMWMRPVPDGDRAPIRIPASLGSALALAAAFTLLFGVSNVATRFGDLAIFGFLP